MGDWLRKSECDHPTGTVHLTIKSVATGVFVCIKSETYERIPYDE
jgi:hypothetical protein